jgi:hypothetical protein
MAPEPTPLSLMIIILILWVIWSLFF